MDLLGQARVGSTSHILGEQRKKYALSAEPIDNEPFRKYTASSQVAIIRTRVECFSSVRKNCSKAVAGCRYSYQSLTFILQ